MHYSRLVNPKFSLFCVFWHFPIYLFEKIQWRNLTDLQEIVVKRGCRRSGKAQTEVYRSRGNSIEMHMTKRHGGLVAIKAGTLFRGHETGNFASIRFACVLWVGHIW